MSKDIESYNWSEWRKFPDPRKEEYLTAPFGCGVYQLRNDKTDEFVLFGRGKRCALRMTSLLPPPLGAGTRNNETKRDYVKKHIKSISYRTLSFKLESKMKAEEKEIKQMKIHKYNT
jgi:hypothetical protein